MHSVWGNYLTIFFAGADCFEASTIGLPGRKIHVGSCCRSVSRRTSRAFGGNGMIPHLTDEEAAQRCSGRLLQLVFCSGSLVDRFQFTFRSENLQHQNARLYELCVLMGC